MKKTNVLFLIIITLILSSCGKKVNENEIIGRWKIEDYKYESPNLSSLSPGIIKGAKNLALSTTYNFHNDKTVEMKSGYVTKGITGKFEINSETNTLRIDYPIDNEYYMEYEMYEIEFLGSNRMKWNLKYDEGKFEMTLIKE